MAFAEVSESGDQERNLFVDHVVLVAVDKLELDGGSLVAAAQLGVSELKILEMVVLIIYIPSAFKDLSIVSTGAAVNFEEISGAKLASPNVVAAGHALGLEVKNNFVSGFGFLVTKESQASALITKRLRYTSIRGFLNNVCEANFATADVLGLSI
jgi:hypothetical protein